MPRTVNEEIITCLRRKILSGGFDRVTFLPPERKLAEEYQVGRGIIRGTLRVLKEEGIIYNVPKRGFRIKNQTPRRLKRFILRLPQPMSVKAYETMGIVSGICAGANELFAEVLLSTPPAELDLKELRERFNADDIQGIVFLEQISGFDLDQLKKSGIPFVIANQENELDAPSVRMDYREAGRLAGLRLFQAGCRRPLVYSGPLDHFIYRDLLAGFRGAAAEENIPLDDSAVLCGTGHDPVPKLADRLTLPPGQRPEAVFTLRDYRAAHVYEICEKLSLRIPGDLEVISYDNITWPEAENRGLTSVTEEVQLIGRESVQLLRKIFESGGDAPSVLVSGQLIERGSLKTPAPSRPTVYRP